jgi:hypothetical protein
MPALPNGEKNLVACSRCPVVSICDAHGGKGWQHKAGVVPCVVRV